MTAWCSVCNTVSLEIAMPLSIRSVSVVDGLSSEVAIEGFGASLSEFLHGTSPGEMLDKRLCT